MHISSLNCAKTMSPPTNDSDDAEGGGEDWGEAFYLLPQPQRWRQRGSVGGRVVAA